MAQRERRMTGEKPTPADGAGPDQATRLRQRRQETDALMAEADAVIDRVLSGDSEAFNAAVRQKGGQ